ncbi:hypothetical protein A5893_08925 [Pedobacter psychrophilus]|uniref:Damage-inducible protein DinB n=1 Tax=Pedobacter psychrophilus TaxID=1826909 RepID=A0A179DF71_9SPHI|nr:DinB family protein [Pedobacter psychrophilus]OAQ39696.1 hypothetical protein A5893_08925 [Pedobacter psychrophilus]
MKSHFIDLFNYDYWANCLIQQSIDEKPILNPKIENLFSHLLSAQKIWLNRCINKFEKIELWETKSQLKDMMDKNHQDWIKFLNEIKEEDLEKLIHYQNTKGKTFQLALNNILTHLINHNTYHRGQIVQLLKSDRENLPATDYFLWVIKNADN